MYIYIALGTLASAVLAQQAITFGNTTFSNTVTVGDVWPISFTQGNGNRVSVAFGNTTTAFQIASELTTPGTFDFKVALPADYVAGSYQLGLMQDGAPSVFSPVFRLAIPVEMSSATISPTTTAPAGFTASGAAGVVAASPAMNMPPTTSITAIYINNSPGAVGVNNGNVTNNFMNYIYYDDDCSCHKTSSCAASAMPTTAMSTTTVTYHDANCGCTTTITAPCAPTVVPMPVKPAANSTTSAKTTAMPVAPAATTAAPVAPASTTAKSPAAVYTGAAVKMGGSGLGIVGMMAAVAML